jgi:diguanylate cyclase (GGDEF)-like protein
MPVPVLMPHQSPSVYQRQLRNFVSRLTWAQTALIGVFGVAIAANLDWVIDHYLAYYFAHTSIYMLPVGFVAWAGGMRLGALTSALAAASEAAVSTGHLEGRDFRVLVSVFVLELATLLVVSYVMAKLRYLHEEEKYLSRTDQLTGLANSRAFWESMELEIERMKRSLQPLTVLFIDVDDFKQVNDGYGHREGDRILRTIATALTDVTRSVDSVARLGGDEFVALLPGAGATAGKLVADRLRYALEIADTHPEIRPKVSMGLATFRTPPDTTEALLHAADMLMYEAKTTGKNKVAVRIY